MARATKTYGHFCVLARALERVGDRWTLLVIRDLLKGTRRFSDLVDRLGGITPSTLTQRLRDLEAHGIVTVDRQAGRRDVWYRLTPAGEALGPVVRRLSEWGLQYAFRPPEPHEVIHPEHVASALRLLLDGDRTRPTKPVAWQIRFTDGGDYVVRLDGERWQLEEGLVASPDLVVEMSRHAAHAFLASSRAQRKTALGAMSVSGSKREARRLFSVLERMPAAQG